MMSQVSKMAASLWVGLRGYPGIQVLFYFILFDRPTICCELFLLFSYYNCFIDLSMCLLYPVHDFHIKIK